MPINVDGMEELLTDHPNPLFVASICSGLCEGFWPWENTLKNDYPVIYDGSRTMPVDNNKANFICQQRDIEIQKR